MSQLMESMLNRGLTQPGSDVVAVQQQQQQGLDLMKVLWRWKWLPILGSLIGAGVGYMFYTKVPEQFQSIALVQVGNSLPASSSFELYDPDKVIQLTNKNDESRVIKSQKVLSNAVRLGNLSQFFEGMSDLAIVFELMDINRGVIVEPAEKSDKVITQQLLISYISRNPDAAQAVVNAVIAGYQAFLADEFKSIDFEMLSYFKSMEQASAKSIAEMNQRYLDFRQQKNDVLWNVDQAVDPYFEEYLKKKEILGGIAATRIQLKSLIQQVTDARQSGRPAEDCLMMLDDGFDLVRRMLFEDPSMQGAEKESERLERTTLVQLKVREEELLKRYGANHPSVLTHRALIEAVVQQIDLAKQSERRLLEEQDKKGTAGSTANPSETSLAQGNGTTSTDNGADTAEANQNLPEGDPSQQTAYESMAERWLQMSLNAMTDRYQALGLNERELTELAQEELAKSQELQHVLRENNLLQEQLVSMKELHASFAEKVRAFEFTPQNANHKVLRELNPATQGAYYGPFPARYVVGGAVLGILLMSGLAVLMDLADRSYRSPDEIVSDLGKPVLGHVPAMDLPNIKKVISSVDASIITLHHSRGRIAEAFRSVRTGLFFSSRGSELKVVQITSPVPGDGKSTLSANLAVTMAQSGRRVLLMDADFRRPRLHKVFGIEVESGLAQLVGGEAELDDVIYTTCVANLSLMAGGKRPNNPAELLSTSRFAELLDILREKYDIIIIDTPPLLAVSDPSVVASLVDGVVLTMRLRRNVKPLATRAFRVLESVDAQILGVVVNGVSTEAAYGGYGYNYSYNDYRYSYRSNYNYGHGYRKYTNYAEYSAGYIEDKQSDAVESELKNDAHPQS